MSMSGMRSLLSVLLLLSAAPLVHGVESAVVARPAVTAHAPVSPPPAAASPAPAANPDGDTVDADGKDTAEPATDDDADEWSARNARSAKRVHRHRSHDGDIVSFGHDSILRAGERADSVVSILGSSTSEGDANQVVAVFGDAHVTGTVSESAVAVLGTVYIDSKVAGDAVAVVGNIVLGPNADVGGDVVAVVGAVQRDPSAVVRGGTTNVFAAALGDIGGLHEWIKKCLLYGRPLALEPGLGWAWTLTFALLAFYIALGLMFRSGIQQCVTVLETQPGQTALAALLALLLTPVLLVLLFVTVIGIAAVPFVVAALFCVALFGKAVMLAWVGRRIVGHRADPAGHPAVAILVGGAVVTVAYLVPVLGFLVYKLLGVIGFGAVVYTLVLNLRARQAAKADHSQAAANAARATASAAFAATAPESASAAAPAPAAAAAAAGGASAASTLPPRYAPASAGMPRAGFWVRMIALFLDVLLVGFAMSLLHPFVHFSVLVLGVYGAVMWKLRGSTIGGLVFDLRVVRLDGREVDWETSIVRALGCFLSLAVVGLGFIWIAFDDANQAWHDKIAGTVVVRVPKSLPLA